MCTAHHTLTQHTFAAHTHAAHAAHAAHANRRVGRGRVSSPAAAAAATTLSTHAHIPAPRCRRTWLVLGSGPSISAKARISNTKSESCRWGLYISGDISSSWRSGSVSPAKSTARTLSPINRSQHRITSANQHGYSAEYCITRRVWRDVAIELRMREKWSKIMSK